MSEDQQLLSRVCCGDRDALGRLYVKYRDDMFAVSASLLHDVHACEDCVQDVFVMFAGAAGKLNIRRNLKGYLISCVANRARDYLRKRAVQLDCSLEELELPATTGNPVDELIASEESRRIYKALAKLPYSQREVFVLHVQGDMKFRQIAGLQDVSIKTVISRYRYGVKKLQAILDIPKGYDNSWQGRL